MRPTAKPTLDSGQITFAVSALKPFFFMPQRPAGRESIKGDTRTSLPAPTFGRDSIAVTGSSCTSTKAHPTTAVVTSATPKRSRNIIASAPGDPTHADAEPHGAATDKHKPSVMC